MRLRTRHIATQTQCVGGHGRAQGLEHGHGGHHHRPHLAGHVGQQGGGVLHQANRQAGHGHQQQTSGKSLVARVAKTPATAVDRGHLGQRAHQHKGERQRRVVNDFGHVQARAGQHEQDDEKQVGAGAKVHPRQARAPLHPAAGNAQRQGGEQRGDLEHHGQAKGHHHGAHDQREAVVRVVRLRVAANPRGDVCHQNAQNNSAKQLIQGQQHSGFQVNVGLTERKRQRKGEQHKGQHVVQRDQRLGRVQRGALGVQLVRHVDQHRGRGRHGDGGRDDRRHGRHAQEHQQRQHAGKGQQAFEQAGDHQGRCAQHHQGVQRGAQLEQDQAQGHVNQGLRARQVVCRQQAQATWANQQAHGHETRDGRQPGDALGQQAAQGAKGNDQAKHGQQIQMWPIGRVKMGDGIHEQPRMLASRLTWPASRLSATLPLRRRPAAPAPARAPRR